MSVLNSLKNASLFAGLSAEDRDIVAQVAHEEQFRQDEYLFHLGTEADTLYVIRKGVIQLTLPTRAFKEERELVVEELSVGDTLAWSALVEPNTLTMNARAATDAELVGFRRKELTEVLEDHPLVGYRFLRNLSAVIGQRLSRTQAMWARELQRFITEKTGR